MSKINPKFISNARKYIEWRPTSLAEDIDYVLHYNPHWSSDKKFELPVLMASILRNYQHRPEIYEGQRVWINQIAKDLGVFDEPTSLEQWEEGGPQSRMPEVGIGWNDGMYGLLVEATDAGDLESYLLNTHGDLLDLSTHFLFLTIAPTFNMINWKGNPLEVKE